MCSSQLIDLNHAILHSLTQNRVKVNGIQMGKRKNNQKFEQIKAHLARNRKKTVGHSVNASIRKTKMTISVKKVQYALKKSLSK